MFLFTTVVVHMNHNTPVTQAALLEMLPRHVFLSFYSHILTASCLYGAETAPLTVLSVARSFFQVLFCSLSFSLDVCVLTPGWDLNTDVKQMLKMSEINKMLNVKTKDKTDSQSLFTEMHVNTAGRHNWRYIRSSVDRIRSASRFNN